MEFFQYIFASESERTKFLRATATSYLTLSAFYSAFVFFVTEKLRPVQQLPKLLFAGAVVSMIVAFVLSLWVVQLSKFMVPTRPREIIENYGESEPTDEEFFDKRIAELTVAYERNCEVNDRKALVLKLGGYALLVGLVFHALFFLDWICNAGGFNAAKS